LIVNGGLDAPGERIMSGGTERIVGENAKWFLRNKFIYLKQYANSPTATEKMLLKIINVSIPVTFNKDVYYDTCEKKMPKANKKKSVIAIQGKAMELLDNRLDDSIDAIVDRAVGEYNLRAPLFWVLADIIKYLAYVNKKLNPSARKLKLSPEMALIVERVWGSKNYFKYTIETDSVPNNAMALIAELMDTIEKNKPPQGMWAPPQLNEIKYPCYCPPKDPKDEPYFLSKDAIKGRIEGMKAELRAKLAKVLRGEISTKKQRKAIIEYIKTILAIEHTLIEYVYKVELYYVEMAKNMTKLLDSLKVFFQSSLMTKAANSLVSRKAGSKT
jgi:hypothetical protein